MSTNDDIVERLLRAFTDQDLAATMREDPAGSDLAVALREVAEPDLEVELIAGGGLRNSYTGVDGLLAAWVDWTSPFSTYRIELDGESFGDNERLVTFTRQIVTPVGTDATIEQDAASVWFSRDDRVWRIEFHLDRETALRSAGLGENS